MSGDSVLMIGISEAIEAIRNPKDVKDALRMAMKAMKSFWLSIDDDIRLKAAIAGTMEFYGKESKEWEQLSIEVKNMAKMNAYLSALSNGLQVEIPDFGDFEPIGIARLWAEL